MSENSGDNINALLSDIRLLSQGFTEVNKDNIFTILNKERDERTHCRILNYLIKEDWNGFCKTCLHKHLDAPNFHTCEHRCDALSGCKAFDNDKYGSIDIFFEGKDYCLAIEVKIDAKDQPLQLLRYYNALEQSGKKIFLYYLTIDGKDPSIKSINCDKKSQCNILDCKNELKTGDFCLMSLSKKENGSILDWLSKLKGQNEIAKQYYEILQKESKDMAIKDYLTDKDSKDGAERFSSAYEIYLNYESAVKLILDNFFEAIKNLLKAKDLKCNASIPKNLYAEFGFCIGDMCVAVCKETNLYARRFSINKTDNGEWHYISKQWFGNAEISEYTKDENYAVNAKVLSDKDNPIVKWYFSKGEERDSYIKNLVENLIRYAKN